MRAIVAEEGTNAIKEGDLANCADSSCRNDIWQRGIGGAFAALYALGAGFLEKVYENAPAHQRRKAGLVVEQQRGFTITYDGIVAGEYVADVIVE